MLRVSRLLRKALRHFDIPISHSHILFVIALCTNTAHISQAKWSAYISDCLQII